LLNIITEFIINVLSIDDITDRTRFKILNNLDHIYIDYKFIIYAYIVYYDLRYTRSILNRGHKKD